MRTTFAFVMLGFVAWPGVSSAYPQEAAQLEFFEAKIRPVLVQHCYQCHSVESGKSKGGLRLDTRSGWQVGGDSGPAIVPRNPDESLLFAAISYNGDASEMPPKSRLSEQVVSDFRKWIADGAIDPREGEPIVHAKETIDIEAGRSFWSFQPRKTFSEEVSIDGLVAPKSRNAPAEKLVRRLFLDLVGLPPTLSERDKFLQISNDRSPQQAVRIFTDQLLKRPAFGEKWARHWLDVARYADSNGGDFNLTFPEAWRYRNYVIDAFNDDMPYDQFLREQIAGDLLPAESIQQRNRQLVATGFLMVAPKMLTERDKPKMHLDIADEQVDTIGRAIMGLTLGCARCHDHKFDPIPTADYYAMAGILHSTRTADGILMNNVNVSGWTETDLALDEESQALLVRNRKRIKELESQLETLKASRDKLQNLAGIVVDDTDAKRAGPWRQSKYRPNRIGDFYLASDPGKSGYAITWKTELPKPGEYEVRVSFGGGSGLAKTAPYVVRHAKGETRLTIDQTVKPTIAGLWYPIGRFTFGGIGGKPTATAEVHLTDENAGGHVIADAIQLVHVDQLGNDTPSALAANVEINALEKDLATLIRTTPKVPKAMVAKDHGDKRLGDLHIRIRGEAKNLGPRVRRGFLQVASRSETTVPTIPEGQSGRRELAEWITQPDHPLTARVMVNRVWQQLFGRGIVSTTDNFGVRGTKPTNPELLDYLAEQFVANDWSVKTLIREIVLSRTYQQAARTAAASDPDNARLRHQNRRPAPAETIRDSILAIAGQLDRKPRESVVDQLGMYAIATSGKRHVSLSQTGKLRQRSIYMPIVRGAVPPALAVFDMPNPDLVTGTRAATNVPAQALFMMNSPFVADMAEAVSSQVSVEEQRLDRIIRQLYQRVLIRDADDDDVRIATDYLERLIKDDAKTQEQAVASFVQVLFSSAEFRFIE